MRLDIDMFGAEQLFGTIDRQLLGDINKFATAIISLRGVAFGEPVGLPEATRLSEQLDRGYR